MKTAYVLLASLALLVPAGITTAVHMGGQEEAPDLTITELTGSPEAPIEGEATTFTATVRNDGDADALADFVVQFLVDGEQVGENKTIEGLRFSEEIDVTSDAWTAEAGDHDVRAIVDAQGNVTEHDETNNEATTTVTAEEAIADLVAGELSPTPETVFEGENVTFHLNVSNEGTHASGNFTVRFLVDGTVHGEDVDVSDLDPGETTSVTSENWTAEEGEHTIEAIVDPADAVEESEEGNNTAEASLTVHPEGPDLAPEDLALAPEAPVEDDEVTFTANVTNQGNQPAENVTVQFHLDGEQLGANLTLATLGAGETVELTSQTWTAENGTHTVEVLVDTGENVTESDEANNQAAHTFTVAEEPEPPEEDPEDPDEGDEGDEGDGGEGQEAEQVTICHVPPGNPSARHTITVGRPAWENAHQHHGDTEGPCEDEDDDAETTGHEENEHDDHETSEDADAEATDDEAEDEKDENEAEDDEREDQARGNGRGNGQGHGPPEHARGGD